MPLHVSRRAKKLQKILHNEVGRVFLRALAPLYYRRSGHGREVVNAIRASHGKDALLITIAYKRADLIELQSLLLARHFRDSYVHVVADNSPGEEERALIRDACTRFGAHYVPLPSNPAKNGSYSHGLALNWVQHNIVDRSRMGYVGYLDHDIFPFRDVTYRDRVLEQGSLGHFQRAREYFFYWPGLNFVAPDFFRRGTANFMPTVLSKTYLDTGGANWKKYYSKMSPAELRVLDIYDVRADDPDERLDRATRVETKQDGALTILDRSWVHLVAGSGHTGVEMNAKTRLLLNFLETNSQSQ